MNNTEAIAYACVAAEQLNKQNIEVTRLNLRSLMWSLMDQYTEEAITEKYYNEE